MALRPNHAFRLRQTANPSAIVTASRSRPSQPFPSSPRSVDKIPDTMYHHHMIRDEINALKESPISPGANPHTTSITIPGSPASNAQRPPQSPSPRSSPVFSQKSRRGASPTALENCAAQQLRRTYTYTPRKERDFLLKADGMDKLSPSLSNLNFEF